jgi:quercetin dioxygenase-like cupin family protein
MSADSPAFCVLSADDAACTRVDADWGSLTWLAGTTVGNADDLSVARVVIRTGCANPPHRHPDCEEILHLLSGELCHYVGPAQVRLQAGDTLTVRAGQTHHAVNTGREDAEMIVAYSSGDRGFERAD